MRILKVIRIDGTLGFVDGCLGVFFGAIMFVSCFKIVFVEEGFDLIILR